MGSFLQHEKNEINIFFNQASSLINLINSIHQINGIKKYNSLPNNFFLQLNGNNVGLEQRILKRGVVEKEDTKSEFAKNQYEE